MQDGQSYCCYHQLTAMLPFSCNSVWSPPPPARGSNPGDQLQDPPPDPLWEVSLSYHLHSQLLCFSQSLLGASSAPLEVGLSPHPCSQPLLLYPHSFTKRSSLSVQLLAPTCSPGQGQHSTPTSAVSVRLQFTVYAFQFCWKGDSIFPVTVLDCVPKR
jgi:hypothetical protein